MPDWQDHDQHDVIPNLRRLPGSNAGRVFRSAALCQLSDRAQKSLRDLELVAVVDLREPEEVVQHPDELDALSNSVTYHSVPLYRGPVPLNTPIDQVYRELLTYRSRQIAAAVSLLARYGSDGVLVHCRAGKDRTGLVVGLALAAVGVEAELIVNDYSRSGQNLPDSYRRSVTTMITDTLGHEKTTLHAALKLHLTSPRGAFERALRFIEDQYGSAADYLRAAGMNETDLHTLGTALIDLVEEPTR